MLQPTLFIGHKSARRLLSCRPSQIFSTGEQTALKRSRQPPTAAFSTSRLSSKFTNNIHVEAEHLSIKFANGKTSKFHHIWLRDNCRCGACFHPYTKQRLVDTFSIPLDVRPKAAVQSEDGHAIDFQWPDGHKTQIPLAFLELNSYAPPVGPATGGNPRALWNSSVSLDLPRVNYGEITAAGEDADRGLLQWLKRIDEFGFCLVEGVPPTPEATEQLVRRIAFVRETHYGGFWDFTSNLEHGDTAYTDLALRAHTDTTYFSEPAGLQLFHLLSPPTSHTGGASLLVDGFAVAAQLRKDNPKAYEVLSSVPIRAHASGGNDVLIRPATATPVLTHDPESGELVTVRWNGDDRMPVRGSADQVGNWYKAAREWEKLVRSPKMEFWMQMKMGEALIFDNQRVLHGRSAFSGERRLCGAYVPHDDWRSKLRTLQRRLSPQGDGEGNNNVWDDID